MDASVVLDSEITKKVALLVVVIVVATIVQTVATRATRRVMNRANVPQGSIFVNLVRGLVWFLALLTLLDPLFGVKPTSFVAALGVTSIALSFGLQDTISNIVSGLTLMLASVIKPGDWIEVGGYRGVVTDITWRATTINTLLGDTVVIPNSVLNTTTLNKLSPLNARSVVLSFDIHPEANIVEVEQDIRHSVELAVEPWVDPELGVLLIEQGYGSFGFRVDVRVGLRSTDYFIKARSAIIRACSGRPWLARW